MDMPAAFLFRPDVASGTLAEDLAHLSLPREQWLALWSRSFDEARALWADEQSASFGVLSGAQNRDSLNRFKLAWTRELALARVLVSRTRDDPSVFGLAVQEWASRREADTLVNAPAMAVAVARSIREADEAVRPDILRAVAFAPAGVWSPQLSWTARSFSERVRRALMDTSRFSNTQLVHELCDETARVVLFCGDGADGELARLAVARLAWLDNQRQAQLDAPFPRGLDPADISALAPISQRALGARVARLAHDESARLGGLPPLPGAPWDETWGANGLLGLASHGFGGAELADRLSRALRAREASGDDPESVHALFADARLTLWRALDAETLRAWARAEPLWAAPPSDLGPDAFRAWAHSAERDPSVAALFVQALPKSVRRAGPFTEMSPADPFEGWLRIISSHPNASLTVPSRIWSAIESERIADGLALARPDSAPISAPPPRRV
jgi:hypothetical protein